MPPRPNKIYIERIDVPVSPEMKQLVLDKVITMSISEAELVRMLLRKYFKIKERSL